MTKKILFMFLLLAFCGFVFSFDVYASETGQQQIVNQQADQEKQLTKEKTLEQQVTELAKEKARLFFEGFNAYWGIVATVFFMALLIAFVIGSVKM